MEVYYFHNLPSLEHCFLNPDHCDAVPLDQVLANARSRHASILLFSDAGAARRRNNPDRLHATDRFVVRTRGWARSVVCLNPTPGSRWRGTTAELIASIVPMFELSTPGWEQAMRVLRGKQVSLSGHV